MSARRPNPIFESSVIRRLPLVALGFLALTAATVGLPEFGAAISDPVHLNTDALGDSGGDSVPHLTTDGAGNWVAVWASNNTFGGTIGSDLDILVARSTDNGVIWTDPAPLNTDAYLNSGYDYYPRIATDGSGTWVAVWEYIRTMGEDSDVRVARSTDNGLTWTDPALLNTNAALDSGSDTKPRVATDGAGNWVAVWGSNDSLGGTIGTDADCLVARSADNAVTWTDPAPLNGDAATDDGGGSVPRVATDGAGNWVAVWYGYDALGDSDLDTRVARSTDNGETWTYPEPLNNNAATDGGDDHRPDLATDGNGNWVAVWSSDDSLDETIGTDWDLLFARSTDNGVTWTDPAPLNGNAATGSGPYQWTESRITADRSGNWVTVWYTNDTLDGTIGGDWDLLAARSTDNGRTWTYPEPLNTNADADVGSDSWPEVTSDGVGNWSAVWGSSQNPDEGTGWDRDILISRFVFYCDDPAGTPAGGRLLFPPLCTRDAGDLAQSAYAGTTVGINRSVVDSFYLSSSGRRFSPLVVDDLVRINGVDSGLGAYEDQPGRPPFILDIPIENNLVPLPAHEVTTLIPPGSSNVLFELTDTAGEIYGNTAVHLVRDCGIHLEPGDETTLHWLSHAVEVEGSASDLDVVSGGISELRADGDFARALCLGSYLDTTEVVDERDAPEAGDGYYYLVRGTCGQPIGYGDSSLEPDPRDGLVSVCP